MISIDDSFSYKSLWLSINRPCLLQEMYLFSWVRNHGVICSVDFTYTRSLIKRGMFSNWRFLQFSHLMCPLSFWISPCSCQYVKLCTLLAITQFKNWSKSKFWKTLNYIFRLHGPRFTYSEDHRTEDNLIRVSK